MTILIIGCANILGRSIDTNDLITRNILSLETENKGRYIFIDS